MIILNYKWEGYFLNTERRQGTSIILVSERQKGVNPRG